MGKTAIDVSEQIELLRQRGMIINDEAKAKEVLLDLTYYVSNMHRGLLHGL